MSSPLPVITGLVLTGLAALTPPGASGQSVLAPAGGEMPMSGPLRGDQALGKLAVGAGGGLLVWQDNSIDGAGLGIGGRWLTAGLLPYGTAFQVNEQAAGDQGRPSAAVLADGGVVVVWQGGRAGAESVQARFFNGAGTPVTGDVLVSRPLFMSTNRYTTNWPIIRNNRVVNRRFRVGTLVEHRREFSVHPVVATLADGTVVVAYASYVRQVTNEVTLAPQMRIYGSRGVTNTIVLPTSRFLEQMQDIHVQRFTGSGRRIGEEFRANQTTKFNQREPAIAALSGGGFVVVWVSEQRQSLGTEPISFRGSLPQALINHPDVYARLFDAEGRPLGEEFAVTTTLPAAAPAVAALPGGGFRVVWAQRSASRMDGWDIYTRRYDATGSAVGEARRVNTHTFGDQHSPCVAASGAGELVVWTSLAQDGSWEGVFGQWLVDDAAVGPEFRVNTTTALRQHQPAVVVGAGGQFLVVWSGLARGSGFDLFGQVFSVSAP